MVTLRNYKQYLNFFYQILDINTTTSEIRLESKGQLILKANCQAIDSPKKRTNEFAFFDLKSCYIVK